MRRRIIVLVTLALGSVVLRADEQKSKIEKSPAYDKMKTLVGSWEGKVNEGGTALKTNARFSTRLRRLSTRCLAGRRQSA